MGMKQIESKDNPTLKDIMRIRQQHAKEPGAGIFIEGVRLCMDALASGVLFETLILSRAAADSADLSGFAQETEILVLADHLFEKVCATKNPQGMAAVVRSPILYRQEDIPVRPDGRYLLCEAVQDPGNFGGIIRTADAFGFDAVFFTKDTADPFNEKVLRSSMGSVFHIPLVCVDSMPQTVLRLCAGGAAVYAAHLKGRDIVPGRLFRVPCAILVGNEGQGIREETAECCDELLRIPMRGKAESLNVSGAAAILCFLASQADDQTERAAK